MGSWSRAGATDPVRTAVRFPMRLGVRLKTDAGEIDAITENISSNGLLFVGDQLPAVDSRIEFTIDLPAEVMGAANDVCVHCTGRVVRHQMQDGAKQAAAIIDEYFLKV